MDRVVLRNSRVFIAQNFDGPYTVYRVVDFIFTSRARGLETRAHCSFLQLLMAGVNAPHMSLAAFVACKTKTPQYVAARFNRRHAHYSTHPGGGRENEKGRGDVGISTSTRYSSRSRLGMF